MSDRKKKVSRPIPWAISVGIALIPRREEMSEEEAEKAIRRVVRKHLPKTLADYEVVPFFEEYNEAVSQIIEEELARN